MISTKNNQTLDPLDTAPPSDIEAEKWVIGSILLNADLLDDLAGLRPDDFYDPTHAAIFEEILSLHIQGLPVHVAILKKHLGNEEWEYRAAEIA